jgi:hypothetical protein
VELGHIVWIATADTTSTMPRSLLDRIRVLAFPLTSPWKGSSSTKPGTDTLTAMPGINSSTRSLSP